ncbi:hypothetical protein M9434_006258 [Picochlorum sp. BPE23]|nr:hypothetical protein M9434_006258 [Picochlorum sp. BPE23]
MDVHRQSIRHVSMAHLSNQRSICSFPFSKSPIGARKYVRDTDRLFHNEVCMSDRRENAWKGKSMLAVQSVSGCRSHDDGEPESSFDSSDILHSATDESGTQRRKSAAVGWVAFVVSLGTVGVPAARGNEWYPRRHTRRMKSQSSLDALLLKNGRRKKRQREREKKLAQQKEEEELRLKINEARSEDALVGHVKKAMSNVFGGNQGHKKAVHSVGVSARPPPSAYYGHAIRQRDSPVSAGMLLVWGMVGLGIFVVLKNKFGWTFPFGGMGQGTQKSGRWVRDRSLGGKMVFIEDSPSSSRRNQPRPLWEDLPGDEDDSTVGALPGYGSDDVTEEQQQSVNKTPLWYAPPSGATYVSASRREELQKQANSLVRQLQNQKIESGLDYSLSELVSLRLTCHKGGGLTVTPSTQSGRDSMLRMAVKHSLLNPSSSLGGYEPARFVSGIASDLGVPQERAITIVHAEIASLCRNALIDAEAAFRSQDEPLLSRSLSKVIHALQNFPIPVGSAEMDLVGRSVMQSTSLEFRKAVFFSAGSIDMSIAPIIAEAVGFDPDLVMPQLLMEVQSRQQAQKGEE